MRRALLLSLALGLSYCSSSPPPTPPVSSTYGVFTVVLSPDSADLDVEGPDGTKLLEGLPASSDVGVGFSQNDDAPPMTGFAVRDVATTYDMLYGAFKIVDAPNAPWRVAAKGSWTGGAAPVALLDGNGAKLATIQFSRVDDDGHLVADIEPGDGPERRFSWGFRCADTDHFLGFGEQTWGVDGRNESIPIWVQEEGIRKDMTTDDPVGAWFLVGRRHSAYMPMPEFLSSRGIYVVAETDHLSEFALCKERADVGRIQLQMPVKLHLFYGPDPKAAITRMTARFGRPRVPPNFAFAPWNDAIFGSANVRRVADKLRQLGIPSSVIWTEDWRGGEAGPDNRYALKEEWEVDRTLYPDFEQVATDLHAAGFKWLVYFNPFVEKGSKAYPEASQGGYLIQKSDGTPYLFQDAKFTDSSLVDLSRPEAIAWAVGKMQDAIKLGADGWMGDYSEWLPTDSTLAGGSGLDLHNRYPVLWQEAQRQALDGMKDGVERLDFVRTGWFGTPGLADVFWGGDQQSDFQPDDGLPTVLPAGLGVGLAGVSTYGSDVGGYQNVNSQPVTKELFFRWAEVGAFSPVMRTHHGSAPNPNWSWESDAETTDFWTRYAKQHIALAPYLEELARRAHDTGIAIWRPLAVEFPGDARVWPVADEVMMGEGMLVAPVLTEGATSRDVMLPAGTSWFPWSGGAPVAGGGTISAPAPVSEIPVYARAGAVIPTFPDGVETLTHEPSSAANQGFAGDDRVLLAFAGDSGSFSEQNGAVYTLSSGPYAASAVAPAVTYGGTPLAACTGTPAPPCFTAEPDGIRAYVKGAGKLAVTRGGASLATLEIATSDSLATFEVRLRF